MLPIVNGAHAKASHQSLGGRLEDLARLGAVADRIAFLGQNTQVQTDGVHDGQTPVLLFQLFEQLDNGFATRRLHLEGHCVVSS